MLQAEQKQTVQIGWLNRNKKDTLCDLEPIHPIVMPSTAIHTLMKNKINDIVKPSTYRRPISAKRYLFMGHGRSHLNTKMSSSRKNRLDKFRKVPKAYALVLKKLGVTKRNK